MEEPTQPLTFLCITLDTHHMEARLPPDKLQGIRIQVAAWLRKKNATKKDILSLVGLLQHATKVVKQGRTFVFRIYAIAAEVKKLSHRTTLTKEFRSDLCWWHMFVTSWNSVSFLHIPSSKAPIDYQIWTDASNTWGCGAWFENQWFESPGLLSGNQST